MNSAPDQLEISTKHSFEQRERARAYNKTVFLKLKAMLSTPMFMSVGTVVHRRRRP